MKPNSAVMGTGKATAPVQNPQLLLRQAGIEALQRKAGFIAPENQEALPELAPSEDKELCSPEAASQLDWLIKRRQQALLNLWIAKIQAASLHLPYEWLVPLLEHGADTRLYGDDAVGLLLGERGKWLADLSQEKRWEWVHREKPKHQYPRIAFRNVPNLQNEIAELLPEDTRQEHADLAALRQENPQDGLLWLIQEWEGFDKEERWKYLQMLRTGLNQGDEIWLMNIAAGLQEKDGLIVQEAQIALGLLSLMPEQKMVESICKKVFSTLHLSKEKELLLDFIWSVSYEGDMVFKAHIGLNKLMDIFEWRLSLDAILKLIPMQAWTNHFKAEASALMLAASQSSHAGVFAEAWAKRIAYENNLEFAEAWLWCFAEDIGRFPLRDYSDDYKLFAILPWEQFTRVLGHHIK